MFWNSRKDLLTREDHAEAVLFRLHVPVLKDARTESAAIREALFREAEVGRLPVIIDLSEVTELDSTVFAWLLPLRNAMVKRSPPFERRRPTWEVFAFYEDQTEALEAIRQGEPEPLLFCGARPEIREVFAVCGGKPVEPQ